MIKLLDKLPSYLKYTPYSFSRLSSYMVCPRRFYYQYVNPLPQEMSEPSIYLEKGSYIHSLLEHYVKHYKEFKELLTIDDLKIKYNDELEYPINFMDNIKEFEDIFTNYISTERFRSFLYYARNIEVEHYIELKIPNTDIILFRGYIDLYLDLLNNIWIIDYKSGQNKNYEAEQLKLYAIMELIINNSPSVIVSYEKIEHNDKNDYLIGRKEAEDYLKELVDLINVIESHDPFNITNWSMNKFYDYVDDEGNKGVGSNCTYCIGNSLCEPQFKNNIKSLIKGCKNG